VPIDCAHDDPDQLSVLASHEIIEGSTDPNVVMGWIDNSKFDITNLTPLFTEGEAADIWIEPSSVGTFATPLTVTHSNFRTVDGTLTSGLDGRGDATDDRIRRWIDLVHDAVATGWNPDALECRDHTETTIASKRNVRRQSIGRRVDARQATGPIVHDPDRTESKRHPVCR